MLKEKNFLNLIIGALISLTGLYVWFHPLDTLVLVALYLGIFFILLGGIYIFEYFRIRNSRYITYGIVDIVIGVILASHGAFVATTLAVVLGFWILFSSIIQIITSVKLKQIDVSFWIYPLLSGIIGIIFSIIVLSRPSTGVLTIAIIIGTYMIIYGVLEISEYFLLKDIEELD